MYYRNHKSSGPRTIQVRYAGPCACCGARIEVGTLADYYPAGNGKPAQIAHMGGLNGNSPQCYSVLRADHQTNDYAGDGLDARYEDQCRDMCGL